MRETITAYDVRAPTEQQKYSVQWKVGNASMWWCGIHADSKFQTWLQFVITH